MPIAIPVELPLAGILVDLVSGAVAMVAGLCGLLGGTAHYLAVLTGREPRHVEVRTGMGFFFGMALGTSLLVSDFFV